MCNNFSILAKIIWKLQYGGYLQKFYYSRNGFRKFNDLMPHLDDIKYDERKVEHMQALHAILKEYLMPEHFPNDTEFLGIYGRLCINSFNILDDDLNSVGTGIYLAASILDHSCKPNAVAIFDGPQLSIRLIEDIPELNWDKIRISYVDQMDLAEVRKSELKKRYYFDCDCEKCTDETITCKMTAMACPNEKDCDGFGKLTKQLKVKGQELIFQSTFSVCHRREVQRVRVPHHRRAPTELRGCAGDDKTVHSRLRKLGHAM